MSVLDDEKVKKAVDDAMLDSVADGVNISIATVDALLAKAVDMGRPYTSVQNFATDLKQVLQLAITETVKELSKEGSE